jgi:hypothetical protein
MTQDARMSNDFGSAHLGRQQHGSSVESPTTLMINLTSLRNRLVLVSLDELSSHSVKHCTGA